MSDKELQEMAIILMEMGIDTYLKCKYMILSDALIHSSPDVVNFFKKIFSIADRNRPLLIGMKEGVV